MELFSSIGDAILEALASLWEGLVAYLPSLIAGIIILILGIFVARAIEKLLEKLIEAAKIDELIRKINVVKKIEEGGTKVVFSQIFAWMVKWFLYVALLIAVSEILRLGQFTLFLKDIALYLPNVIIAVLILVVGFVLGYFVDDLIVKVLKSTRAKLANLVGSVAKWAIIIFTVLAALIQLKVAVALIQMLFTAFVFMLALALGLAFGLGGKDAAKETIEEVKRDLK
ncbi:MAG: hypothetical protein A2Y67_04425 [Candidatus Buchananbacteria bacterium RBG_13_39_9]|jgi:hypothetical protein|uniref:Small-conductance mechanosensitive ion channel n=1 Tax=Candidatus Buchananbacteria bacterium RBG_13_39_9 TaxID=1797531 RepID=A0A1G1XSH4_9BACT|nr:MAG: hypothetical protein A2Y67_04425 [Candidatus Buchananbacteria bacterium RBG_13_39_9]